MTELTAALIKAQRQELLTIWQQKAHSNWEDTLSIIQQRHEVGGMVVVRKRRLSTAASTVRVMLDTLITDTPNVTREPLQISLGKAVENEEEGADKSEIFGQGTLDKISKVSGIEAPFRASARHITEYGYYVLALRWMSEVWPKKPQTGEKEYKRKMEAWENRRKVFPFEVAAPHPARVLIPHNDRIPSLAIETSSIYGWQFQQQFPQYARPVKPNELLEVIMYWDDKRMGMVVGDDLVEQKDNEWGFVPYLHGYSGWGQEHSPIYGSGGGSVISLGAAPEDMAVGILDSCKDSIVLRDELVSSMAWVARLIASRFILTKENAEALNKQIQDTGGAGAIQVIDPQSVVDLPKPVLEPWMFQYDSMLRSDIERATFPSVVEGQWQGTTTATAYNQMLSEARKVFGAPMKELNDKAGLLLGMCAKMLVIRDEELEIKGVRIKPSDFHDNFDFTVDFMAKDEGAMMRARVNARDDRKEGIIGTKTALKEGGRGNVTQEIREVIVEKLVNSEQAMSAVLAAAQAEFTRRRLAEGVPIPPEGLTPLGNEAPPQPAPQQPPTGRRKARGQPEPFITQPQGPQEQERVMNKLQEPLGGEVVP